MWNADAQADLFHAAFRALGIDQAMIMGHSWGTFVALAMALNYPNDVLGLVLASGYYFPSFRLDVPVFSGPAIPVIGDLMRFTISPLLARLVWPRLLRHVFAPSPVTEQFRKFPTWMALRPLQLRAAAEETALMIPNTLALKPRYESLAVPTILIAGDGDRHVNTKDQSARFHEAIPQTRLIIMPHVGHMVHQIAPNDVVEAIETVAEMAGATVLTAPA
jgi:pimeloyl-ACP methyl ester carboxylesterase